MSIQYQVFFFFVIIQKIIFWRALQRYVALHGLHGANAQNMKADFFCLYKNMVEIWFDFGAQCLGQATGVNHWWKNKQAVNVNVKIYIKLQPSTYYEWCQLWLQGANGPYLSSFFFLRKREFVKHLQALGSLQTMLWGYSQLSPSRWLHSVCWPLAGGSV